MIDLHIHTTASDGQYTPSQIMAMAADADISVAAITDHDTVAGLAEAATAAKEQGIRFVPGTELSIDFPTGEFHLLGLGLRQIAPSFTVLLEKLIATRNARNEEIIEKMRADGVEITLEEMRQKFPDTVLGRPHFARMLVEKKVAKSTQEAFVNYLRKGKPWFVQRVGSNLDEAVAAIQACGGIPVIAHPMSLYLSWGKMPEVLEDFYARGVLGLEAFHPGARVTDCLRLEELAGKIGFFVTGGSDFHGEKVRADRKLGHTCGGKKISDEIWEKIAHFFD